jgi:hypothetical protein
MQIDFNELMSSKTDKELHDYLNNRIKYVPEAIEAAIEELKRRGKVFSAEEVIGLNNDIQQKRIQENKLQDETFGNKSHWQVGVVKDTNAPLYYSKRVIYIFSIAFGVLFGSVLLTLNINKANSKGKGLVVIAYGLMFTILQVWILSGGARNSTLTLLTNGAGGYLLYTFFWKKYLGENIRYRARPFFIPLLIGLVIIGLLIWLIVLGDG